MPHYHFHIRKGPDLIKSVGGIDVLESEPLREEAIEAARDSLAEGDLQGVDRTGWIFEIANEAGETVLTFPFAEAFEPDASQSS